MNRLVWAALRRPISLAALLAALVAPALAQQRRFVYTNDNVPGQNAASGFAVGTGGALARVPGSPFGTGSAYGDGSIYFGATVVPSPVRRMVFVASGGAAVTAYAVDPETGSLTKAPGTPTRLPSLGPVGGYGPTLAVSPDGRFLVVGTLGAFPAEQYAVFVYRILADGSLERRPEGEIAGAGVLSSLDFSPDGRFLVGGRPDVGGVSVFAFAADGAVSEVPGSPFDAVSGRETAAGVAFTCAGDRVYVGFVSPSGTAVGGYALASDGRLTPLPGSPYVHAATGRLVDLAISPDDRFVYASASATNADLHGIVLTFAIGADGALSSVPRSPYRFPPYLDATGISVDGTGEYLYVANGDGQVSTLVAHDDGSLTNAFGSPFSVLSAPAQVVDVGAYPGRRCAGSPTLFVPPPADVAVDADALADGRPGAAVAFDAPDVESDCGAVTVACSPASGSFFPVGTTTVTCSATDACGGEGSASFVVTVRSPFGAGAICLVDDASGDTLSLVTAAASPLRGAWVYRVAATGADLAGRATIVDRPGKSLTATGGGLKLKVNYRTLSASATVRGGGERRSLRDADSADDPACP